MKMQNLHDLASKKISYSWRGNKDSYPHDSRADKRHNPHNGCADKNPYLHDRRADRFSQNLAPILQHQ